MQAVSASHVLLLAALLAVAAAAVAPPATARTFAPIERPRPSLSRERRAASAHVAEAAPGFPAGSPADNANAYANANAYDDGGGGGDDDDDSPAWKRRFGCGFLFGSLNYTTVSDLTGGSFSIPPDCSGGVSPDVAISVVNVAIAAHDRNGTLLWQHSLETFFSLGTQRGTGYVTPTDGLFDPRVIWDRHANRFLIVVLRYSGGGSVSSMYVAASTSASAWNGPSDFAFFMVNTRISSSWLDYPQIGVDSQALYVSGNLFTVADDSYNGYRLFIFRKTNLYSFTGAFTYWTHDLSALANFYELTLHPADVFGSSTYAYLVGYSGLSSGPISAIEIVSITNPLTASPTFKSGTVDVGRIDNFYYQSLPPAPQLGSSTGLDSGDRRVQSAVWRNGKLYAVTTIAGSDGGAATTHYLVFDAMSASPTLLSQGDIDARLITRDAHTFYPAIGVNSRGDVKVGFSMSSPTMHASFASADHCAGDPFGDFAAVQLHRRGVAWYVRTFSGTANRWGDYSSVSVDPVDDLSFWVYNEYAMSRGQPLSGEDGRWATAWGYCEADAVCVTPTLATYTDVAGPASRAAAFLLAA